MSGFPARQRGGPLILPEPTADSLSNLGRLASSPTASPAGRPAPFLGGSPVFRGLFAALVSVSAGPPAGGRATTCFSDCGAVLFDFILRFRQYFPVCWCRSPTSTIEAPVSVDTLAPDSLSQQVYSRVRQSLAGAIAQPRPCATLRFNSAAQTSQPCCKGEAEHRVLETRPLLWTSVPGCAEGVRAVGTRVQDLARGKTPQKKALRGRLSPTYSASSVYEILWNCPVSGLSS